MARRRGLSIAYKALSQLGLEQVGFFALYRLGLLTGYYTRVEAAKKDVAGYTLSPLFQFPTREEVLAVLGKDHRVALLAEADEIVSGKVRLFGGKPQDLRLKPGGKLAHWTDYEVGKVPLPLDDLPVRDIKFLWEPARFGWAFTLGRAYFVSGEEKYAESFWRYYETFAEANPPTYGVNWVSAQEVAFRLMALVWAAQVFAPSPASTPERRIALAEGVAHHACRIPITLAYSRSQNNNHLISEAAGMLTASYALPDHPKTPSWRKLGWKLLNRGLQRQIDSYGEYVQHSTNYQRLMLEIVLWVNALIDSRGLHWPFRTIKAVNRSVHWLLSMLDPETGGTPNLGANDGAYIFPLTVLPFADYRPVVYPAARLFLHYEMPHGSWDELGFWFGLGSRDAKPFDLSRYIGDQLYARDSWAYLRTEQYGSRPSHADQLHFDLWWHGLNVAWDPGTYLYNTPPPWDNSLTDARVHNTVTVNDRDQFTRASRFLYLDWFDAYQRREIPSDPEVIQFALGYYRHAGYRHERTVKVMAEDRWLVEDAILRLPFRRDPLSARLHWLFPDLPWRVENQGAARRLILKSPIGEINIIFSLGEGKKADSITLVRAGEYVYGKGPQDLIRGWVSPTYGVLVPGLSLAVIARDRSEVAFSTEFIFPKAQK